MTILLDVAAADADIGDTTVTARTGQLYSAVGTASVLAGAAGIPPYLSAWPAGAGQPASAWRLAGGSVGAPGSGDFYVELDGFFGYDGPYWQCLAGNYGDGVAGWGIYVTPANGLFWQIGTTGGAYSSGFTAATNTRYVIRYERVSGVGTLYVGGSPVGSWVDAYNYSSTIAPVIGADIRSPYVSNWGTCRLRVGTGAYSPAATYAAAPDCASIAPGQSVTINVATSGVADGTTIYWTESGTATADDIDPISGSFTVNSNAGSFEIDIKPGATAGRTITIEIRTGSTSGPVVDTADTVTITLPAIAPDVTEVDEGGTVTYTVTGPDGTYGWSINATLGDANGADIGLGDSYSTVTVTGGTGTITRTITEDFTTEGVEELVLDLWDKPWPNNTVILATSDPVTINDTSNTTGVDFSITPSATNVNEGGELTLTATSSVMPPAGLLYYAAVGTADNSDFDYGQGEIIMEPDGVGGAIGTVVLTVSADESYEGTETCTFKLRSGGVSGPDVATTGTITIADTSIPPPSYYLLMGNEDVEGGDEAGTLFVSWVATGTTFYWEVDPASYMVAADFLGGVTSGTFTNSTGDFESSEGAFAVYIDADNLTEVHPHDIGTATSATATTLTDSTKAWEVDQQANKLCVIVDGTGDGQRNIVLSNDADTLTFAEEWDVTPDATSEYRLEEWFRVNVYRGTDNTGELVASEGPILIEDLSLTAPTFGISQDKTIISEGGAGVTYTITATYLVAGELFGTITGTAAGGDFTESLPVTITMTETVYPTKVGTAALSAALDESLEGVETFTFRVHTGSSGGPVVATAEPVSILDESYTITPDVRKVAEGNSVTFTVIAENASPTETLYWIISAESSVTDTDFVSGDLFGTVELVDSVGTIVMAIADDATAEGLDFFYVELHRGSVDGARLAVSPSVLITEAGPDYDEFNSTLGGVRILLVEMEHSAGWVYFGSYPYVSYPDDTNPNRPYDDALDDVVNIETRIDGALVVGEIIIDNDGTYDYLLPLKWTGYTVRYLEGRPEWSLDDFRLIAVGTNGGIDTVEDGEIVFASYDRMAVFDQPLQNTFLADGRPVPFSLGKPFNVPAVLISQPDDRYQVHETGIVSVTPRDNGADVASTDTLGSGYFDLDAALQGTLAADVVTSVTTVSGAIALICTRVGKSADSATVTALPDVEIGLWYDSNVSCADVLRNICDSVGAFPVMGADGEIEAYVLTAPAEVADSELSYLDGIENHGLRWVRSREPYRSVTLNYRRNWAPASRESIAGSVITGDPDFAESLTKQWSTVTVTNSLTGHPLADALVVDTYLVDDTAASTECARLAALYAVRRDVYEVDAIMPFADAKPGKTVKITYPAFGFESGRNALIISVSRALTEGSVTLEVWL